jgi:toxin ParE1/3/4
MPESNFVISALARADIKAIAKYTIEAFGARKSLTYARGQKEILGELAANPELGKSYAAVKNKILMRYRYRAHVIFCHKMDSGIFIVRVPGGRMDFPKHVK